MTKRKKRLEKSIKSIEQQILLHHKKKEIAKEEDKEELVSYFEKEIASLKERKRNREEKL